MNFMIKGIYLLINFLKMKTNFQWFCFWNIFSKGDLHIFVPHWKKYLKNMEPLKGTEFIRLREKYSFSIYFNPYSR